MNAAQQSNRDVMLPQIVALIRRSASFVVTGHELLDGDGAGSEMALFHGLTALGKSVLLINNEPLGERFRFLDPEGRCQTVDVASIGADVAASDALIVVDNNSWTRLGLLEEPFKRSGRPIICLDHHVTTRPFSSFHLYDLAATSTGEIVHDVLMALGVRLDHDISQALYTTLCTDSGWFKHGNTTRRTFELAARFVAHGVRPEFVSAAVNLQDSVASKRLLARLLESMCIEFSGVWCWGAVTRNMLDECGCSAAETDGFVDQLRSIRGVKIIAFFKELRTGGIKVSLRSRGDCSALAVARVLGGGGHNHAAGITMRTDLRHAVAKIRAEIARQTPG